MSTIATSQEVRRRRHKHLEKKERQTSRLWAEGARETILAPHVEPYADALARSWVHERDYVAQVQNHYHQVISWRLPDDEEPALPLPAYDPRLIAPQEDLSEEEKKLKSGIIARRNEVSPSIAFNVIWYTGIYFDFCRPFAAG